MGPEHSVSTGKKVKYLLWKIDCDHEIMHMSKMMLAKNKQDMDGEFERNVDFLSDALSNREMTHNCFKLNTCDDEADINSDNNDLEGGDVTGYFTIQISFFCLFKKSISPQPKRISKTACRKWSVRLNLKYT